MAADTEPGADAPEPEEQQPARPELFGCPVIDEDGVPLVFVARDRYTEVFGQARQDGFELCSDVTAVDYLAHPGRPVPDGVGRERFEVVVTLVDVVGRRRLRFRTQVPDHDPRVPSLFDLWPGSDAMEREVYDMFGIVFEGHPDLTRILMPEDWEGHPLRKDYAMGRVPVQFKEAPGSR